MIKEVEVAIEYETNTTHWNSRELLPEVDKVSIVTMKEVVIAHSTTKPKKLDDCNTVFIKIGVCKLNWQSTRKRHLFRPLWLYF